MIVPHFKSYIAILQVHESKMMIKPGRYLHYKGKEYKVLYLAKHSETMEELVVYQQMYGDHSVWVRPAGMFMEMVNLNGKEVPRFKFLDDLPEQV